MDTFTKTYKYPFYHWIGMDVLWICASKYEIRNYDNCWEYPSGISIWSIMPITETHCLWQDLDIMTKQHLQVEISQVSKFFWVMIPPASSLTTHWIK